MDKTNADQKPKCKMQVRQDMITIKMKVSSQIH